MGIVDVADTALFQLLYVGDEVVGEEQPDLAFVELKEAVHLRGQCAPFQVEGSGDLVLEAVL